MDPAFTLHMFAVMSSTLAPYVAERSSPQATCTRFRVERSVRMCTGVLLSISTFGGPPVWFGVGGSRQQVLLKGLPALMRLKGLRYTLNEEQVYKE